MRPPSNSDVKGGASSTSSSSGSLPLHMAGSIYGVTVRRARRRTAMLLSSIKGAVMPPSKPHEPMTSWGSFLFLSNLIMGPGILGLPAAYRHSGVLAATLWTVGFAAASVLACVFIAHATRIYRNEARGCAARGGRRANPTAPDASRRAEAAHHASAGCDGAHAGPPAASGDGCVACAAAARCFVPRCIRFPALGAFRRNAVAGRGLPAASGLLPRAAAVSWASCSPGALARAHFRAVGSLPRALAPPQRTWFAA